MSKNLCTIAVGGKEFTVETGTMARQAHGSVVLRCGETILLATACRGSAPSAETDFFPLRVDYQEKFSSAGRTLGGFIKREGKPSEREVLLSRLIDRPIRPMFEEGYFDEVQILTYVLSYDGVNLPDPLAICAASAALVISDIPLIKPIGAVRVGWINGQFVVNPTSQEMEQSRLDLILAGTADGILMVEGYADFLTEEQMLEAVQVGHKAIEQICVSLSAWQAVVGKSKKSSHLRLPPKELLAEMEALIGDRLQKAYRIKEKVDRSTEVATLREEAIRHFLHGSLPSAYSKVVVDMAFKKLSSEVVRRAIVEEGVRVDGRTTEAIRPISIELSPLPRTHGSALFTRGETQSLAVCTLGSETMGQRYEDLLNGDRIRRFYLQYFFPPFSVGEVGRMGAPGRREVGHGKLAERALGSIIPTTFPYVVRLESNILESNGSSSMASVCGGCLALMDAGVPIKAPVAGIAMGLIFAGGKYAILSDILGDEDALGDMDFKVAGDMDGITAFQLDLKIDGISYQMMKEALDQAKRGRRIILQAMAAICPESKKHLSQYAPRIETVQIKPSKIGIVIGPGGKQIRAIMEDSGATVDINDSGIITLSAQTPASLERAKEMIHNLTAELEVGSIYVGRIAAIIPSGVKVKIFEKEGLCHISEFDHGHTDNLHAVCKEGDTIEVKVMGITDRGQIRLSRRATLPSPNRPSRG